MNTLRKLAQLQQDERDLQEELELIEKALREVRYQIAEIKINVGPEMSENDFLVLRKIGLE